MDVGRPSTRPALVAVNPRASRLRDGRRRADLLDRVRQAVVERTGIEPEVCATDDPVAMVETATSAVGKRPPLVVVVGGDGTARDIAEVMLGRDVPLAIVPVGTANLFAASLGIPMRPKRAVAAIPGARVRQVDVGRVRWGTEDGGGSEPRLFVVGAGLGFDARVMAATGDASKRRLGRYAYFLAAARQLVNPPAAEARLEIDGELLDLQVQEVLVANAGALVPGVLRPALPINAADGLLDVFVVAGSGPFGAALGALEAVLRRGRGRSRSGRSWRLRVRRIRVIASDEEPVEVDGDVVGSGWLAAECEPGALGVLVPAR